MARTLVGPHRPASVQGGMLPDSHNDPASRVSCTGLQPGTCSLEKPSDCCRAPGCSLAPFRSRFPCRWLAQCPSSQRSAPHSADLSLHPWLRRARRTRPGNAPPLEPPFILKWDESETPKNGRWPFCPYSKHANVHNEGFTGAARTREYNTLYDNGPIPRTRNRSGDRFNQVQVQVQVQASRALSIGFRWLSVVYEVT